MMKANQDLFGVESPVALITGAAAPRVGQTIARELAKRGYSIAIHGNTSTDQGLNLAQEFKSSGLKSDFFQCDLSESGKPERLVEEVYKKMDRIDLVVNSAAIWYPTPLDSVSNDELQKFFQINSVASFQIAKSAGLIMAKQSKGGVIINIGDWATTRPYTDYSAYFLSKGNLDTMTRMLAVELATLNSNIRVNAVLPGPVMIPDSMDAGLKKQIVNATLLKREGSPQNVADACLCLIENDFITGVCLPVDGGRSIYSPYNPV